MVQWCYFVHSFSFSCQDLCSIGALPVVAVVAVVPVNAVGAVGAVDSVQNFYSDSSSLPRDFLIALSDPSHFGKVYALRVVGHRNNSFGVSA